MNLLLVRASNRNCPFNQLRLGELFHVDGDFHVKTDMRHSTRLGTPGDERTRTCRAGQFVMRTHILHPMREVFVTAFLVRTSEGVTLEEVPATSWPAWAENMARELSPESIAAFVPPVDFWSVLQDVRVGFYAGVTGAFRDIHALWVKVADWLAGLSREPTETWVTHDWLCEECGHWSSDYRDGSDETCEGCGAGRPGICEYRKHQS